MADVNKKFIPASQIVIALCDLASQGRYDGVTREGAQNMNNIYELAAQLINQLEAEEKAQLEKEQQEAQANEADKEDADNE